MYDLVKSFASRVLEKQVATGQTVTKEGLVLVSVLEGGVEKVQPCSSSTTEKVVGFSTSDNQSVTDLPKKEQFTLPAVVSSTCTVTLAHPPTGAFGTSSVVVFLNDAGSAWTEDNATPTATTHYQVNYTTGQVIFDDSDTGKVVTIGYRYALTVAQAQQMFYQRNINNTAGAIFNQVGMMTGEGEMYTMEYDTAAVWHGGSDRTVRIAAGGKVTIGGSNSVVGLLIKSPSVDDPTVGIKFNLI